MPNKEIIVANKIRCKRCNVVLESKFRHDYQLCKCANPVGVDGGTDYRKRMGRREDYEELSVVKADVNYAARREKGIYE